MKTKHLYFTAFPLFDAFTEMDECFYSKYQKKIIKGNQENLQLKVMHFEI